MKLCFCPICGTNKNLSNHHIIPKSMGGTDHPHNMLTLCDEHHGMIHLIRPGAWINIRELQRIGIEKAKKNGVYVGKKPHIDHDEVRMLWENGLGATEIARQMGIHRDSVYRITKQPYRKLKNGQYTLPISGRVK